MHNQLKVRVTDPMPIRTLKYQVSFTTPAFLGNADQDGQWRTPPFKALLRQWWRLAWAAQNGFSGDFSGLRKEEAELFGSSAGDTGKKSRVRLRLSRWSMGTMGKWGEDPKVDHCEVGPAGKAIGSHLYLGFGPLNHNKGTYLGKKEAGSFKPHAAIQAGAFASFSLAFPASESPRLDTALSLMHHYGTIGGRSRNGWGSFILSGESSTPDLAAPPDAVLRPWQDALALDWPHALGRDEQGPLIWRTELFDNWKMLMQSLAKVKIELRTTQFEFHDGKHAVHPEARHWLSYPVTNHHVKSWGNNRRLPNSLRFKVRKAGNGKLQGVIIHVPCRPPAEFTPDLPAIMQVWSKVHGFLDKQADLTRTKV